MVFGEKQYIQLIQKILKNGERRVSRNGTTLSLFGEQLRFSLHNGENAILPLLTTKFVPYRLVLEELEWFLKGRTDNQWLMDRNVKIWDANAKAGPLWSNSPVEDLGPIYGFQWRHFGAKYQGYKEKETDYKGEGIDQIDWILKELKTNPGSRRAVMSAWNPLDFSQMTLPPCHVLSQYWIGKNGLSCHLYQRSADVGLGIPFNIASYATLTHIIAHTLGIRANELVMSFGDTHIYESHIEGLTRQASFEPYSFPMIHISADWKFEPNTCELKENVTISNYKYHERIRLPMIA